MIKILVFGFGEYYHKRKNYLKMHAQIVAIIDNNKRLYTNCINKIPIISPYNIASFSYDKIIIMSSYKKEMKKQLLEIGINEDKILYWEEFRSGIEQGKLKLYCRNNMISKEKRILIISTDLNYDGGSLAAVYAAMAMQKKRYNVILAAPSADSSFIREVGREKINIIICPSLPYLHEDELFWIQQFDIVIVNVFQMILCAYEINKIKPVLWWIHEPKKIYENIIYQFSQCAKPELLLNINTLAVSNISQKNFNYYFPNLIKDTLAYGIPDQYEYASSKETLIFALIGAIQPLKAQDIFIQAVKLLKKCFKKNVQFWIIGHIGTDSYSRSIKESASQDSTIQILGKLTRDEIRNRYKDIDVVVCPSQEDSLPIVMTEGMMYRKVCITSDTSGTAAYIKNGQNGFICKKGNAIDLSQKMEWIINNKGKLQEIGEQARKTYEKYFTLEKFGNRLESALLDTMDKYEHIRNY